MRTQTARIVDSLSSEPPQQDPDIPHRANVMGVAFPIGSRPTFMGGRFGTHRCTAP